MRIPDVNVLLYAHNLGSPYQAVSKRWLEEAATDDLAIPEIVWMSFVRIATHP